MWNAPSRAGRSPLALSLFVVAALTACADDPLEPRTPPALTPNAAALADTFVNITVTNASGGLDVGSLRWAANQIRSAGGAIHFDPSLGGATITLDSPLDADGPMYIEAPAKGITLSGNDQHRVIEADTRVSVKNVTLTKGYADYGSAVRANSFYMENTTVHDNRAPGSAIRVLYLLSATNSTVSRNVVGGPAVEYRESAQVFLDNTTIAFNAPGAGLGVSGYPTYDLRVTLNNSIISNNGSPQQNCSSFFGFVYEGKNVSNDWSCGEVGITVADPLLLPLADNGGPNLTHAFSHRSPALNSGSGCWVQADQRYVPRDAKCDVGAFEFTDFTKVQITLDPTVKVDAATGKATLVGTVTCTRDDTLNFALELHQDQKVGKNVVDVHAASTTPVACGTTPRTWVSPMVLTEGAWQSGAGRASAVTYNMREWVKPASAESAVRISISRK